MKMEKLTTKERIKLKNWLIIYLNNKNINNHILVKKFILSKYLKEDKLLEFMYNYYISQFDTESEAVYCLTHNDDNSNHLCEICGKPCKFFDKKHHYHYIKTCGSKKCKLEKFKKTNIEKYGTEYPSQSQEVREKIKTTNLKHCGAECNLSTKESRDKGKRTCLEKYGVEHPMQSEEIKKKFTQTMVKRYGVEYALQSETILKKMEDRNIQLYGVKTTLQDKKTKDKIKQANLEKYGVENPFSSSTVQNQIHQTNLKKYGVENVSQNKIIRAKQTATTERIYGVKNSKHRHIKNYNIYIDDTKFSNFIIDQYTQKGMFLTLGEISEFFDVWPDTIHKKVKELNLEEYFQIKDSSLEIQFIKVLKSYGIEIQDKDRHNKSIILNEKTCKYFEIDIILPNSNIGIEINDISSHNSLNENHKTYKPTYYHLMKTEKARLNDIRLIHIWEWEFKNIDKICVWLANLINLNKIIIYETSCQIKIINDNDAIRFINTYSIYDYKDSDISIGLFYNNDLIQIISFIKYSESDKTYKISNMCTKYGYSIEEGYKEILNYFYNLYNPKSIIAFCELDKFSGETFESLGFVKLKELEPSIVWCNKNLDYFEDNDSLSDHDGYIPIYNCGKIIYNLERR